MSTIFAPLTPVQYAPAIILRTSGIDSLKVLQFFDVNKLVPRYATKAKFFSKVNPLITDEVIITYYQSPSSYTGEDILEISFHGNPLIVRTAMEDFIALGLRIAEPGEFTRRAFLTGKISLVQAESVDAMIHARTPSGVNAASHRLLGDLDNTFKSIRTSLINLLADLEAYIDFHDDDEQIITDILSFELFKNIEILDKLISSYRSASISITGVKVAIIGEPNVGKSSIFNALLKKERAIVSSEAGTTRDMISEQIYNEGINFIVMDTAGIRETESLAEAAGILVTEKTIADADLLVVVADLSRPFNDLTNTIINNIKDRPHIIVGSKSDIAVDIPITTDVTVSAVNRDGISDLARIISEKAKKLLPESAADISLLAERQYLCCINARAELVMASGAVSVDIKAYHIKNAVNILSDIIGDTTEQVLDIIFSKFCIGK